jgi:sugar lactone lactonase YvrE
MSLRSGATALAISAIGALVVAQPASVEAQMLDRIPNIYPMNGLPNPYESEDNWVRLPGNRTWGSTAGVDIAPDGRTIWAIDRCGANSCAGSDLDPILEIDQNGNVLRAIGAGLFLFPHGIHVDRDGNIWVTDAQGPNPQNPATAGKGHVAIKLSPDGEVLLTLGRPGSPGDGRGPLLNTPNDVVTDADGNIYVGDGHGGQSLNAGPETVARIAKFDRDGNFITSWGRLGSGPGEMRTPHAVDIDSQNRLIVGDRGNNRLQIFELDGTYIGELRQFGRPSGIYVTDDDMIYVADSESLFANSQNPGWITGIRVGSLRTGIVEYLIHGTVEAYPNGSNPEGVAVDRDGNVYGAVVSQGGAFVRSSR